MSLNLFYPTKDPLAAAEQAVSLFDEAMNDGEGLFTEDEITELVGGMFPNLSPEQAVQVCEAVEQEVGAAYT